MKSMILDVQDVHKTLGTNHILKGMTFQVSAGEAVALVGDNGSGKSTLISLIVGLRRPSRGRVLVNGGDPRETQTREALGYVHQSVAFPANLKAKEILRFVAALAKRPKDIDELIDLFELHHLLSRPIGVFSGGEAKRLAFASALILNPRLLVLDEVMNSMDAQIRKKTTDYLKTYIQDGGAILFAAHLESERRDLATRELYLRNGVLSGDGV